MEYVTWTVYNKLLLKFYVLGEKLNFAILARSNLSEFYLLSQNYSIFITKIITLVDVSNLSCSISKPIGMSWFDLVCAISNFQQQKDNLAFMGEINMPDIAIGRRLCVSFFIGARQI